MANSASSNELHSITKHNNIVISGVGANEVLKFDGSNWINQTLVEAGIAPVATPTFTTSITIGSATVTEAQLEILDGATVSTAELNLLDGVSGLVQADLTKLAAIDSSAAELNLLDGVSGLVQADLTKLAAIDSTAAEINLLDALDRGSILYGNASGVTTVLGQGGTGTVLTSDGDDISWQAAGGGAVSAVANGSDNRIATFSAATTLNGESALTFNGTTLTIGSDYDLSDANGLYKRTNGTLQLNSNSSMAFNIDSDSNQSGRSFWFYNNSVSQSGTQIAQLDETGLLHLYHTTAGARINIKQTNGAGTSANGHIRIQDENDGQVGYMGKGSSNGTMQFANESAANVTIATSGINRLTIAASGTFSGSSTNGISDERIKENIENTAIGLAEILQLRPVKFNFMAGKGWGEPGQKFYGFLAQEVEAIIPEAVETTYIDLDEEQGGKKRDVNGVTDLKAVTMTQITTALVKAVQELKAEVDALKG